MCCGSCHAVARHDDGRHVGVERQGCTVHQSAVTVMHKHAATSMHSRCRRRPIEYECGNSGHVGLSASNIFSLQPTPFVFVLLLLYFHHVCPWTRLVRKYTMQSNVGETGASCYRGRLLQGHFMQNYYIDGEIAGSSFILIHQGNHWRNKTIDARELYEIRTLITFYTPETCLRMFTIFLLVQSIMKTGL